MSGNHHLQAAMVKSYGKQLVSARRLARYLRALRAGREDQVTISREARRQAMVERVAREIVDNLVVTGADNPVVGDILDELHRRIGARLVFEYPFMEQELQIFRETPKGLTRLEPDEAHEVLAMVWAIALEKVDATMI